MTQTQHTDQTEHAATTVVVGRRRRVVATWLAALTLLAVGGWVGARSDNTAQAATCDELRIDILGLQRCVVPGGQGELDNGYVVRFDALSNSTVHWLTGHRTSHGATFNSLTNLRIGDEIVYRDVRYTIAEYQLVDRHAPAAVVAWMSSSADRLVLQTSASSPFVHVWRAEVAPPPPVVVDPDAPSPAVRIVESTSQPSRTMQEPFATEAPVAPLEQPTATVASDDGSTPNATAATQASESFTSTPQQVATPDRQPSSSAAPAERAPSKPAGPSAPHWIFAV